MHTRVKRHGQSAISNLTLHSTKLGFVSIRVRETDGTGVIPLHLSGGFSAVCALPHSHLICRGIPQQDRSKAMNNTSVRLMRIYGMENSIVANAPLAGTYRQVECSKQTPAEPHNYVHNVARLPAQQHHIACHTQENCGKNIKVVGNLLPEPCTIMGSPTARQ